MVLIVPVLKVGVGNRHGVEIRTALAELNEPCGILVGQRLEQHAIDYADNRGVCADTQRQSEHCNRCESGIVNQGSQRVSDIIQECHTGPLSYRDHALQASRQRADAQIQFDERDRVVDCLTFFEMSERDRSRVY
jgi:hypothetical protein